MYKNLTLFIVILFMTIAVPGLSYGAANITQPDRSEYQTQPFTSSGVTVPEVLLVVSKDLKMFYQGYAGLIVDIDGDGRLDTGFNPNATYIGYFDPDSCYVHTGPEAGSNHRSASNQPTAPHYFQRAAPTVPDDSEASIQSSRPSGLKVFIPSYRSKHGICRGVIKSNKKTFSGNWLNFIVSSRMDVIRKILYGGARTVDTATTTFLESSFVPHDASIWGSEVMADNAWNRTPFNVYYDITKFTPFAKPNNGTAHYFARTRDRSSYGPWDPTTTIGNNSQDGNIFPVLQMYPNASNNPTCSGGNEGHYWDWIMQSRPVPNAAAGCLTDGNVKAWRVTVKVCDPSSSSDNIASEGEGCKPYGEGNNVVYKPTGLLQKYGETGQMRFGLMTGGFGDEFSGSGNLRAQGGLMRNHVASLSSSINPATGQYNQYSLMWALDKLMISGRWIYSYETANYGILYHDLNSWGNPMGEMLFEGIRYMSGKANPLDDFSKTEKGDRSGASSQSKHNMGGSPTLKSPINQLLTNNSLTNWNGRLDASECSKPVIMLLSDIDTSFDGDNIPSANDLNNFDLVSGIEQANKVSLPKQFNVTDYLNVISNLESINTSKKYFASLGDFDDCSPKTLTGGLNSVKGLCPMGPSYRGTYAVAAAAYYAHTHKLSRAQNKMPIDIYSVTMAAAFPELTIDLNNKGKISVLPVNTTNRCTLVNNKNDSLVFYRACDNGGYKILSFLNYFLTDMQTDKNGIPFSYSIQVNFSDFGMGDDWEMDMVMTIKVNLITDSTTAEKFRTDNLNTIAGSSSYVSGFLRNNGGSYYHIKNPDTANSINDLVDLNSTNIVGVSVFTTMNRQASGGAHGMGYTVSGTKADGTYLDLGVGVGTPPASPQMTPPTCAVTGGNTGAGSLCQKSHTTAKQLRTFEFGSGGSNNEVLKNPLWYAAKYGGFSDKNSNGTPDQGEWEDETGEPANYFQATNIAELPEQLGQAFEAIARSITTGTATSASVNSVLGGGISILTAYYPEYINPKDETQKLRWVGTVYGLFVDKWGNLREDSNHDGLLQTISSGGINPAGDYIVTFSNANNPPPIENQPDCFISGKAIARCSDELGNNIPTEIDSPASIHLIRSVWDTGRWLAELDGPTIITGSRPFNTAATKTISKRRIYFGQPTVINGVPKLPLFDSTDATSMAFLQKYLLHDNYLDYLPVPTATPNTKAAMTKKLVEYVQGVDVPTWRTRTVANPWGTSPATVVWRLGDIINSKPIIVGAPAFNYDVLYGDSSYGAYRTEKGTRRQVAYFGSNDGLLHAINVGYFGSLSDGTVGYNPTGTGINHDLGAEIWAYIPTSILPHLQWQAEPDYLHSYMVDMKPLMADIKIGENWHTVLIGGLRLGGRQIENPAYNDNTKQTESPQFFSEIFCLDVTDPESEPKFMWRYSTEELGLSVGLPSVVTSGGDWYVVLPSGPKTDTIDPVTGKVNYGTNSPYDGYSNQNGRLIVLEASTGQLVDTGTNLIVPEANSFFNDSFVPYSKVVNKGQGWNDRMVYYGLTVSRTSECIDSGAVYRLRMVKKDTGAAIAPSQWALERFVTTNQPVSGAVNSTYDRFGNLWVIFGTGRLWGMQDLTPCAAVNNAQSCVTNHEQYLYGIKEELDVNGNMTFNERTDKVGNLVDVTGYKVWDNGNVTPSSSSPTVGYEELADSIYNVATPGYKRKLDMGSVLFPGDTHNFEILFTQPKISSLGNGQSVVAFTTFEPNTAANFCGDLGKSYMYALDTFTGLPSPNLYASFSSTDPQVNPEDGGRLVTGGIFTGTDKDSEATFYQTEGKIIIKTSSGDNSIWDIEIATGATAGNSVISWRESLNTGFSLSEESMTKGLNPNPLNP
jgi:type IV pilus assembly protein PilY1